ncbi:MAG: putative translation elongation factor-1 alpha [Streblomastix strix]|uniref:Putative translation elongation factor-1 alpha n=1 Tax=Streblomastix strix TaxID=222440 RepID=A0A5J4V2H4_9EUKA|nr:MAG: putative translation elongation factor-1 alpha [Streblomastix strix]
MNECKTIGIHYDALKLAVSRDYTQFYLKDVQVKDIKRGFVCGNSKQDPLPEAESLQTKVIVMQHPVQIQNGYTPVLDCHTSHIACKFKEITSKIDR